MSARHERHEYDTGAIRTTQVQLARKILIFIRTRVKTYFDTPTSAIWQMKDYTELSNFILGTPFWKCLVPMPKYV